MPWTVDSHSVCEPLNPILQMWHSVISLCCSASDFSGLVFLHLIELTIATYLDTKGNKGLQFVLTVYNYQSLNLDLVRRALSFHSWVSLPCSCRRGTLPSTLHWWDMLYTVWETPHNFYPLFLKVRITSKISLALCFSEVSIKMHVFPLLQ